MSDGTSSTRANATVLPARSSDNTHGKCLPASMCSLSGNGTDSSALHTWVYTKSPSSFVDRLPERAALHAEKLPEPALTLTIASSSLSRGTATKLAAISAMSRSNSL